MATDSITAHEGKQLTFTVTFPADITGRVPTFTVREKINDPDPPLLSLTTTAGPNGSVVLTDPTGGVVTVTINGPATKTLADTPLAQWVLWLDAGADNADEASGTIRTYQVVQP